MRKSKKTFAILAIVAMVLMMIPVQAFADNASATNRLFGDTRVDTAIAIANNGWANGASTVVVVPANDANLVDALAVAPLAKQLNAPILVTDSASLDAKVAAEIAALKAANVYAVGALSDAVAAQLKALSGVAVTTIKGADRFDTAAQIAAKLNTPAGTFVVGYNGLADALSAASFAAANGYAIEIAGTDGVLPANEKVVGAKTYVLGGPTLVADIAGATRFYGADRYATNDQVLNNLTYKYDKVYVANGETLVDALAGSVLAAQTNSPIVLGNATGAAAAADVAKKLGASSQVVAFGGTAVVPDAVVGSVSGKTTPTGPVSVQSVTAISANSFKVAFTAAPADKDKVTFSVKLAGTTVSVSPSWNADNTVATLKSSSNFAPGTYTVAVKNDATDLGSNSVDVTQQQVNKITVTSKVLSVVPAGSSTNANIGFATYTVQDQYGNDITNTPLGNNITWTPGIGTLNSTLTKNGVIAIDPIKDSSGNVTVPLTQYTSATISGYDTTSYASVSASLDVSLSTGTLSNITLNKLTSPNNDDFNAGNTAGQWYADYTALDASGNATSNYTLVKSGILSINGGAFLNVSTVADPNDNTKAAISVTINSSYASNIVSDTQVPITVLLTNGASSTLNVTLKKPQVLDTFVLSAPSAMVASGETVTIPFTAADGTGNAITDYSKINGKVNLSISGGGSVSLQRNADGSTSVQAVMPSTPPTGTLTVYLTASVTSTGKYSQLTLNVQQPKKADTLTIDNNTVIPFFQTGASEQMDFGINYGGLSMNDQYGRSMDITNQKTTSAYYYVYATVTSGTAVTVNSSYKYAYNGNYIQLDAAGGLGSTGGSSTINYEIMKTAGSGAPNPASDTDTGIGKSVTYTVMKNSDITGYTLDAVSDPLKMLSAANITDAALTDVGASGATYANVRDNEYAANPEVWGKTSGGAKVVLAGSSVVAVNVDSSKFQIENPAATGTSDATKATIVNPGSTDFYIYANDAIKTSNPSATSASTTLTVTVVDGNGNYNVVTTPITSTTSGSTVSKVDFTTQRSSGTTGLSVSGNTVTVDLTANAAEFDNIVNNNAKHLTRYDLDGSKSRADVYFRAFDQFGSKAAGINLIQVTGSSFAGSGISATVAQDPNGDPYLSITGAGSQGASLTNGDYVILSAVSDNGQIATVKIAFKR